MLLRYQILILSLLLSSFALSQSNESIDSKSKFLNVGIKITPASYNHISKFIFNPEESDYWVSDLYYPIDHSIENRPVTQEVFLLNSAEVSGSYFIHRSFSAGLNLSFEEIYHQKYTDAKIVSITPGIELRTEIPLGNLTPFLSANYGRNIVLNKNHDVRPYKIMGNYHIGLNAGTHYSLGLQHRLSLDLSLDYRRFRFEDYILYRESSMSFISVNIGYNYIILK